MRCIEIVKKSDLLTNISGLAPAEKRMTATNSQQMNTGQHQPSAKKAIATPQIDL